jgi:hypothetical protein
VVSYHPVEVEVFDTGFHDPRTLLLLSGVVWGDSVLRFGLDDRKSRALE